jgi:hypothetical protein
MCENNIGLADIRLRGSNTETSHQSEVPAPRKRQRNIDGVRMKRLRRNKKKKLANRNQTIKARETS